tara:strand:+ start:158 stop:499 length:342 start_codon:yes stop_codon:yes gene_type:complete
MKKLIPLILITALVGCAENVLTFECSVSLQNYDFEYDRNNGWDYKSQGYKTDTKILVIDKTNKTMKFAKGQANPYFVDGNLLISYDGYVPRKFDTTTNKLQGRNCRKIENYFN